MPRTSKRADLNVRSITYGRVFNNGNYESSRIDLTVDIYRDDDPVEVFEVLQETVKEFRSMEKDRK